MAVDKQVSVGTIFFLAQKSGWQASNKHTSDVAEKGWPVLISVAELLKLPPPEYLIESILPYKGVAIMAGKSGDMKSFLAISFATAVATNSNGGTWVVKTGNALYMMNEGQAGFGLRYEAWLKYHNHKSPNAFKAFTMTPNLMHPESLEPFVEEIIRKGFCPNFIVFDTYSKAIVGGDDNQTKDVSLAIQTAYGLAEKFDALVLIIDHVGKDPKRGVRGSYAKYGNADAVRRKKLYIFLVYSHSMNSSGWSWTNKWRREFPPSIIILLR